MKNWIAIASTVLVMSAMPLAAAHAENACGPEIEKTYADWQALHLVDSPKPTGMAHGVNGHAHLTSAIKTMQFHMADARALCKDGKDHEALLHLDVVRAFLNLPEIQHPAEHHYMHHG